MSKATIGHSTLDKIATRYSTLVPDDGTQVTYHNLMRIMYNTA